MSTRAAFRLAAAACLLPALAAAAPAPTPDRLAARLHAIDDLAVQAGVLAQQRAATDGVRRYGRVLERDGRLADRQVLGLARAQGLRLGAPPRADEDQALLVRLEGVPDDLFDREFLLALRRSRGGALAELRAARRGTPDRRLAELVGRLLPVVDQERQLAADLARRSGP